MKTKMKAKRPDFYEWLLTEEGKSCNDITNLAEQKYLTNRLFWAFDAGRNCVWDQYQAQKIEIEELNKTIDKLKGIIDDLSDAHP